MTNFSTLKQYYDENNFEEIFKNKQGKLFLKLRSISRTQLLKEFAQENNIDISQVAARKLFEFIFDKNVSENKIDSFIRDKYKRDRQSRKSKEDWIYSQLYKLKIFDWGGLYQNSLEQTIVNNYIKKIQDFDELNKKIENELHASMRGYVLNSWYNHWSSILIEDIFKDHPKVLPTIGLVKKIDFFWKDFPFDLKVTYFPEGFMALKRREKSLRPELTELKNFARKHKIHFDRNADNKSIFSELLSRITELRTQESIEFIEKFHDERKKIILEATKNPKELIKWLYEEQGPRRFDAANRFFLVLVDLKNLEDSWKLKRNKKTLVENIKKFLDDNVVNFDDMKITFDFDGKKYSTYSTVLFVIV